MDEELAGAHALDDGTQRPGAHQDEGHGDQLGHAVYVSIKGLDGGEQLGGHAHDTGADAAAQKAYADGQGDVGVAEGLHQTVVYNVAGPEDGGKQGAEQADDGDDEVPHGELVTLGQLIFYLRNQGLDAIAQQLAGLPGPLLLFVHGPEVQAKGGHNQHGDHGKDAVQVEGEHVEPDAPLIALDAGSQQLRADQAGDEGAVAADGGEGGQVTAHGVQNVCKFGPGDADHVGDGAHDSAQHQTGLGIAENKRAQAGDDLALLGRVDDLGHPGGKGLRGAGGAQHGDGAAGDGDQHHQGSVAAERGDHIIGNDLGKAHQGVIPVYHGRAQPHGQEQGHDGLLAPKSQRNGYDRGN